MKHFFLVILFAILSATAAFAQSNIENAIKKIEKRKTTQYVAYSENRNPETHKVFKASKVLVIDDESAGQFKSAFERDREKSSSLQMARGRMIEVTFVEGGKTSCYTLVQQRNGQWLLTVEIKHSDNSPRRRRTAGEIPASGSCVFITL